MPAMIFISVDLPAPFSPINACTVPACSRKPTWSSATTPGNALTMPAISSNGVATALDAACASSIVAASDMRCAERRGASLAKHRAAEASVLAGVLAEIGRRNQFERDVDELLDRLLLDHLDRRVHCARALTGAVLEHRHLEIARLHRCKRIGGGVDARDHEIGRPLLRGLERVDGADRHLVVVGDDRVELQAGRQPVGDDVLALRARPLAFTLVEDLDAVAV